MGDRARAVAGRRLGGATGPFRVLVPLAVLLVATAVVAAVATRHAASGTGSPGWLRDAALGLAAATTLAVLGVPATFRRERVRRSWISAVDEMSGAQFEERLAGLFDAMGYRVERTGRRGDFGADLVVERGGVRVVVQAKRYERPVGIEAVQQAIGATRHYGADEAMVVTSAACTPAARALAASNEVRLVEREELVSLLAAHPAAGSAGECPRRPPGALLLRQLADGAVLVAYALALLVRLAWRTLRIRVRGMR